MYLSLVLLPGATPLNIVGGVLNGSGAGGVSGSTHNMAVVTGIQGVGVRGRSGGGGGGGVWAEYAVGGAVYTCVGVCMCVCVCVCACVCVYVCEHVCVCIKVFR